MSQWNLIIDVERCENCNNCVLANNDEYVGNDFGGYTAPHALHGDPTIRIRRRVRGEGHMVDAAYLPTMCNHCDDAPCIEAVGSDVIRKRPDGIVIIDPVKAKGRRDVVESCPYGAIVWNEEQQLPQNWIFDAHLIDQGWQEPRCAHSCPTEAIKAVKTDAAGMSRLIDEQKLEVLKPELKSRPRVYYRNLYRYTKDFVGGTVVVAINGTRECVQGADVELSIGGRPVAQTTSDAFGDFKFDALDATRGSYVVRVHHATFGTISAEASVGGTQVLGELELPPFIGEPPVRSRGRHGESHEERPVDEDSVPVAVTVGAGSAI